VDFICRAICFIADHGVAFLPLYEFDIRTGAWKHREFSPSPGTFGLTVPPVPAPFGDESICGPPLEELFAGYLVEAEKVAQSLSVNFSSARLETTEQDLIPFLYSRKPKDASR